MAATQVTKSQCIELQTNPGYYLLKDAAYAWDRAVTAFGKQVLITGAWRSYETQLRIFEERYDRGNLAGRAGYTNDVRWWPAKGAYYTRKTGTASAAVPGTSNHGGGLAVDVQTSRQKGDPPYEQAVVFTSWTDVDRTRFLEVAAEHGWYDTEGRSVNELWHLTYYPARDQHRGKKPVTTGGFMADLTEAQQEEIYKAATAKVRDESLERWLSQPDADRVQITLLRRVIAMLVADRAAPVTVEVDASAVAEALLVRLPKETAEAVANTIYARLAK